MIVKLKSAALSGIDGFAVDVEIDVSRGLPNMIIVGMPDTAIRESRERVRSAIRNFHYKFSSQRIVINLAPASLKKEGALYDLPIALGILKASKQISLENPEDWGFLGELSLDGSLKSISGVLPLVISIKNRGVSKVLLPHSNRKEASLVKGIDIYPVRTLEEAIAIFSSSTPSLEPFSYEFANHAQAKSSLDFRDVKGQFFLKRALEIAASGFHNVLMIGPPGSGKSMLAKRFPTILPRMSFEESLECTKIHSVMNILGKETFVSDPPFRSPHHTISYVGLVGGGKNIHPGEITLAHNGVLFLDEIPEFQRSALEVLRQPLENDKVHIARASGSVTFPARFILIAAMNPCPCGFFSDKKKNCDCSSSQVKRYRSKISGPLLDRIDLHVEIDSVDFENIISPIPEEASLRIQKRVSTVRTIQRNRFQKSPQTLNGRMSNRDLEDHCSVDKDTNALLKKIFDEMGFSAREYTKILKISRTIADMDSSTSIEKRHLLEACQYRSLARQFTHAPSEY